MKKTILTIPALLALSASVYAQENQESSSNESSASTSVSQQAARMAIIDPKTGQLTSTPAEQEGAVFGGAQSRSIGTTGSGVASEPQLMADGSRKIDFNGQFNKPVRVKIDSNGEVETGHHVGHDKP